MECGFLSNFHSYSNSNSNECIMIDILARRKEYKYLSLLTQAKIHLLKK